MKKKSNYAITSRQKIFISDIERGLNIKCDARDKSMARLWISQNIQEYHKFLAENKDFLITKKPTHKQIELMKQIEIRLRRLGIKKFYPTLDRQKASDWITKNLELLDSKSEERRKN